MESNPDKRITDTPDEGPMLHCTDGKLCFRQRVLAVGCQWKSLTKDLPPSTLLS